MNRLSFPLLRWLNGALGVAFLAQAVHGGDGVALGLAILFGSKALLKLGCCSTGPCTLPDRGPGRRAMSEAAGIRADQP